MASSKVFLVEPGGQPPREIEPSEPGAPAYMAWNVDGQQFAIGFYKDDQRRWWVEIWDAAACRRKWVIQDAGGTLEFSPNGMYLLYNAGISSGVVSVETGQTVASINRGQSYVLGHWGPDSERIMLSTTRSPLEIHDVRPEYLIASLAPFSFFDAAWSPDGKIIVASTDIGVLHAVTASDWNAYWTHLQLPQQQWATFSPGGKMLHQSDYALEHLRAVLELDNGHIESLPWDEFMKQHAPVR